MPEWLSPLTIEEFIYATAEAHVKKIYVIRQIDYIHKEKTSLNVSLRVTRLHIFIS